MENTNDEKRYCVYMHRFPNKKTYIGQTCQKPEDRWGNNGAGYLTQYSDGTYKQPLIANAVNKYNWNEVEHLILFDNLSKKDADRIEQICIILFRANNPLFGYNLSNGGNGPGTISEETKKKMSNNRKGKNNPMYGVSPKERMDEETYKLWLEQTTNRLTSDKFIAQNRQRNLGKTYSNEVNKKKGRSGKDHHMYGKHHTEETKEKMRQAKIKEHIWCVELNELFDSAADVKRKLGIDASDVRKVCKGLKQSAGKHPITGEKLHWKFVDKEITNNESIIV